MKSLLHVFSSKRMAVVLSHGFTSGLPLALTGSTLQAWMTQSGVKLSTIGLYSLVGLPYTLKFLWAPWMDRITLPFLGKRRGWLLISQALLILGIGILGLSNPSGAPTLLALIAVLVAFFSASQDIMIDAYRTEILNSDERGPGAGIYIMGYRLGMLFSGALALVLSDHMSWQNVYLLMALALLIGILTTLLAPEPKHPHEAKHKTLNETLVIPFLEFFQRKGALEIILFIILYKLDVVMTTSLTTPFLLQLGFTKTDIGTVNKIFGFFATILGSLAGGVWMLRIGMEKALWIFGLFQGLAGFSFFLLAKLGNHYPMMVIAITTENFCSGMGTAAFTAFLMSLCNQKFTGTQYALLSSFMAVSRVFLTSPTGFMIQSLGWEVYFLICIFIAIPGLLLLTRFKKWKTI